METFLISPNAVGGPALIPLSGSATELDSTPIGVAQPPDNKEFLIFMGPNSLSSDTTIQRGSEFQDLSIDPLSGFITGLQPNSAIPKRGDSFAMDPQGRYYVTGTQDNLLEFGLVQLFGIGGNGLLGDIQLPQSHLPASLWIDSTGTFLYVATSNLGNPVVVNIFSVDLQTGQLTEPRVRLSLASLLSQPTPPTPLALSTMALAPTKTPPSLIPSIRKPATSSRPQIPHSPSRKSPARSPSAFRPASRASAARRLCSPLRAFPLDRSRPARPARRKLSRSPAMAVKL